MSAQNTASIQTLLEAEKDAQQIVEKARQYRTQRLKDARSEAQKEIDTYKSKKEQEFKDYESKVGVVLPHNRDGSSRVLEHRDQRRCREGSPEVDRVAIDRDQEDSGGRQAGHNRESPGVYRQG